MAMVTCVHDSVGGRGPSAKSGLNTARDHRPLPLSKSTYLTLIFSFKWRWYVHARLSRWKGGQQGIPPATKLSQNTASGHRPRIYTIIYYLRHFHVSPRRKNGVRACTTSSEGGGGGLKRIPHPRQVQSCHVTTHQSSTCDLHYILTKKTGRQPSRLNFPLL